MHAAQRAIAVAISSFDPELTRKRRSCCTAISGR